jgi:hypothetical protein
VPVPGGNRASQIPPSPDRALDVQWVSGLLWPWPWSSAANSIPGSSRSPGKGPAEKALGSAVGHVCPPGDWILPVQRLGKRDRSK